MTDSASGANRPRSRFLWGMLLAWVPFLLIITPTVPEVFRGISSQKATGLGAVAGGLSEAFVTFGIVAFVTAQVLAIVFLVRTIGKGETLQNIFAILSIALSAVLIVSTGLLLWVMLFVVPRLHGR